MLSKDTLLSNQQVINNYEASEDMASLFNKKGIPAVSAIDKLGKHLYIIDNVGYLVYPWIEAKALDQHVISAPHALKIAEVLAKIHNIKIDTPEITKPKITVHSEEKIIEMVQKSKQFDCSFFSDLNHNLPKLLQANQSYQQAILVQNIQPIVTHGDLDQKNVLWNSKNQPIIIDWESTCKANATYDFINTAFYWSGITTAFNQDIFLKMVETYKAAGGVLTHEYLEKACYGPFGWIDWLVFNIERTCVEEESEAKIKNAYEVNQSLSAILRFQLLLPKIIQIVSKISD